MLFLLTVCSIETIIPYLYSCPCWCVQLCSDGELTGVFNDATSQQLLMSLLYRHHRYEPILDIMDAIKTGRVTDVRYPKSCVILAIAAALKLVDWESDGRSNYIICVV